ncbi:zinc-binding dehydrogenase [Actinoplanes sp. NPDC026619]|uniref:zinc-binding dehydrogenase n=1 Tax=Actinoplanes sp. NPDC026619 TaxID=3155798 RepID=UPI0033D5DB38
MRAVRIQSFGDPSGMALVDAPAPEPAPGQVLIATEAIGVGGVDAVVRRGTLSGYGFEEGLIPGSEVAGRVIGGDAAWIGRRVWAFTGVGGAYAERAVARVEDVTPLPDGLSPVDAVTLGSAGPVAHFALAHARFAPGESVLVRGAAGSLGIMAVQLAALGGASVIAVTTSSADRGKRLQELGAMIVLNREGREGAAAEVQTPISLKSGSGRRDEAPTSRISGGQVAAEDGAPREFDVVIDIVGGAAMPAFIDRLADNGRMVTIGVVAGHPPADFGMALLRSFQRSRSFATFSLNTVDEGERNRVRTAQFAAAARGELRPVVQDVLPLAEAAEAHRRMDAGEVFGRIVLTLPAQNS